MAARRTVVRSRGFRPSTSWSGVISTGYTTVNPSSKIEVAFFTGIDSDITIRRTRGLLSIASDQSAAIEETIGAFGACVISDHAQGVGISAMPDPANDISEDLWAVYVPFMQIGELSSVSGAESAMAYPFDSKAMRKLPTGYSYVFVLANNHPSHSLQFAVNIRVLASLTGTGR